ncbi:MAG: hypothetical protein LBH59_08280, partial [Planctomycetaceae bacterium]|nr:hypothetical protein [Planctomycetaceae bacterium]
QIPKPVWAVGFALEQTLHVVALAVFSYVDFKVASAYKKTNLITGRVQAELARVRVFKMSLCAPISLALIVTIKMK